MILKKGFIIDWIQNNLNEDIDPYSEGIIYIDSFLYSDNNQKKILLDLDKGSWWDFKEQVGGRDFISFLQKFNYVVEGRKTTRQQIILEAIRSRAIEKSPKNFQNKEEKYIDLLSFAKLSEKLQPKHLEILNSRKVTNEVIKKYKIRHILYDNIDFIMFLVTDNKKIKDLILWNYTGNDKYPKYYVFGNKKSLFGFEELNKNNENLYVAEGIFDSLIIENGVAKLGAKLTKIQIDQIKSENLNFIQKIVLLEDNDKTGLSSIQMDYKELMEKIPKFYKKIYFYWWDNNINCKDINAQGFVDESKIVQYNPINILKYIKYKKNIYKK